LKILAASSLAGAAIAPMKITRVRMYQSPLSRPMSNEGFQVMWV
jgi:hypothetical protein